MLPGSEVPESGLENLDKFIHASLFGLFTFCTMVGFAKQHQFLFLSSHVIIISIIIAILYGVMIELFQELLLEDRSFEWLDIAADVFGVIVGYLFFSMVMGKKISRAF